MAGGSPTSTALAGTINKSIFISLPSSLTCLLKRLGRYKILFLKGRILSSSASLINCLSTSSSNRYILRRSVKTRIVSALRECRRIPNSSLQLLNRRLTSTLDTKVNKRTLTTSARRGYLDVLFFY